MALGLIGILESAISLAAYWYATVEVKSEKSCCFASNPGEKARLEIVHERFDFCIFLELKGSLGTFYPSPSLSYGLEALK